METDFREAWLDDYEKEFSDLDRIRNLYVYHRFTSKSKGRRYHKDGTFVVRKRRDWREVALVKYRSGKFYLWEKAPFDEWATETLPGWRNACFEVMRRVPRDAQGGNRRKTETELKNA
jgi:hypothetical protein